MFVGATMKPVCFEDLEPYAAQAKGDDGLFALSFNKWCRYYAYYLDHKVVGFCAIRFYKEKGILRYGYVLPEFRRKGIHSQMTLARLSIMRAAGLKVAQSNCTQMSLGSMLKLGATVVRKFDNGITQVQFSL